MAEVTINRGDFHYNIANSPMFVCYHMCCCVNKIKITIYLLLKVERNLQTCPPCTVVTKTLFCEGVMEAIQTFSIKEQRDLYTIWHTGQSIICFHHHNCWIDPPLSLQCALCIHAVKGKSWLCQQLTSNINTLWINEFYCDVWQAGITYWYVWNDFL